MKKPLHFVDLFFKQKNRKQSFVVSLIFCSLVFSIILGVFLPRYETNDDNHILMFANGSYGVFDGHLIYTNYSLGLLFSKLYKVAPAISWYVIFYYIVSFISITIITYVISSKSKSNLVLLALYIINIIAFYQIVAIPQYTKVAYLVTIAGMLALCDSLTGETINKLLKVSGSILLVLGYAIRLESFLSAGLIMIGIFFVPVIEYCRNHNKSLVLKRIASSSITTIIIGAIIISLGIIDKNAYNSDEWKYYKQYNSLRTELLDYGWPDYETNKNAYLELGIDESAFNLYSSWDFNDCEKLDLQTMEKSSL